MKQITSSYKKYLYTYSNTWTWYLHNWIKIPMHVSRRSCPSNMILLASGRRKLYILDETTRKIHAFHAYILGCDKFK
jgi:hypothetical protein